MHKTPQNYTNIFSVYDYNASFDNTTYDNTLYDNTMYDNKSGFNTLQYLIDVCNAHDREFVSKCCLPKTLSPLFGQPILTPESELFTPPDWLIKAIKKIVVIITPTIQAKPLFQFSTNYDSVTHNTNFLINCNYIFTKLVKITNICHSVINPNFKSCLILH